jgi:eukaryotic-like serine/threonine-protein kinase
MEKLDQYVLLRKVGTGGMAWVYKAKKIGIEGFERVLAIKRILPHLSSDEEFISMFVAEAKLAAQLTHKNIVQIYDLVKSKEDYLILMEYVAGKDLRSILRRCHAKNVSMPASLALYIGKEVASALSTAHTQKDRNGRNLNIIHRDISPQNILVSYSGEVKVVDFGIAKAESQAKTSTGVLKGKISYMSPEQAWGKPMDLRSDIFSLGLVIYELFTGDKLFRGDTELNTLERVREATVQPLPSAVNGDISPEIESKILKALARDPAERYQNAAEMELDLGRALAEIPHVDPSIQLREFMHDLFQIEIEEEDWVDEDEKAVAVSDLKQSAPPLRREEEKKPAPPVARSVDQDDVAPASAPKEKSQTLTTAMIGAVVVLLGICSYFAYNAIFHKSPPVPLPAAGVQAPVPAKVVAPAPVPVPVTAPAPAPAVVKTPAPTPAPVPVTAPVPATGPVPVTAKPVEVARGALAVKANPWAQVYVEGKDYGKTPQTIKDLDVGTYTVRLENPDFTAWETKVKISKKATAKVNHSFGGFGKLVLNSKPWANIFLDGTPKGQTPLTLDKVSSGEHQVKFAREGFAEIIQTVTIKPSGQTTLSVPLEKKDN